MLRALLPTRPPILHSLAFTDPTTVLATSHIGIALLVGVNVLFVLVYMYAHRHDSAIAAERAKFAKVREVSCLFLSLTACVDVLVDTERVLVIVHAHTLLTQGMRDDPIARCKRTTEEYTVRNGRATLRPNRRSQHIQRWRTTRPASS